MAKKAVATFSAKSGAKSGKMHPHGQVSENWSLYVQEELVESDKVKDFFAKH